MLRPSLLTGLLVLAALPQTAAAAIAPGECVTRFATEGCATLRPVVAGDRDGYAQAMALSPDGRHAYFVDGGRGRTGRGRVTKTSTLFVLAVGDGTIRQQRGRGMCLSSVPRGGCTRARALDEAWDIAVSPDGRFVLTASYASSGVAIFRRDAATGRLTQLPGRSGCVRGKPRRTVARERCRYLSRALRADSVQLTPDGRLAYVGGVAFRRDVATGALTPISPSLRRADGRRTPDSLASVGGGAPLEFAPGGRRAFRWGGVGFEGYDVDAATGALRVLRCGRPCAVRATGPRSAGTISPDARFAYLADEQRLQPYAIGADGAMTPVGAPVEFCRLADGSRRAPGCEWANHLVVDGDRLFVFTSALAFELRRDPESGLVGPGPADACVGRTRRPASACGHAPAYDNPFEIALTPDAATMLVHGEDGVQLLRVPRSAG